MKKTKSQRGITLVTLIVTILILLLLAVVAIAAIKNQNVIGQAGKATGTYNTKVNEEIGDLGSYEGFLNEAGGNTISGNSSDKIAPTKPTEIKKMISKLDTIIVRAIGGTDESGVVAGYKYSIDGNNWSDIVKTGVDDYYTFINLEADTEYTIYAKTVDGAGNESEAFTTRMSTLGNSNDKIAPTKPTEMKNLRSTLDTISVRATGGTDESGVVAGYKYSIDGNNWSDIVKPGVYYYTFRNLNKSTQYTIYAKTVDGAGNESEVFTTRMSTSYEITFYVDDVAYTAYEGMYWEEWIASDWNTGDFSYNWVNNQVLDGEGNVLYESDNGIGWVCGDKNNEIHAHIRYKAKF